MQRMPFTPAIKPDATATPDAWCFAFVEGQLLVLEQAEGQGLAPQPWSLFEPLEPARHYLGQLDGLDCWAFTLDAVPPGWKRAPLLRRLRHTHRAAVARALAQVPRVRPHRLPAAEPGDDGAGVARASAGSPQAGPAPSRGSDNGRRPLRRGSLRAAK